jgi:hypothetical protein
MLQGCWKDCEMKGGLMGRSLILHNPHAGLSCEGRPTSRKADCQGDGKGGAPATTMLANSPEETKRT